MAGVGAGVVVTDRVATTPSHTSCPQPAHLSTGKIHIPRTVGGHR